MLIVNVQERRQLCLVPSKYLILEMYARLYQNRKSPTRLRQP